MTTPPSTMDPAVVENLRTSFVNNLDATQMDDLTTSMEYFTELSSVFQDLMNNEIEASNFMAMYNDVSGKDQTFKIRLMHLQVLLSISTRPSVMPCSPAGLLL